SDIAELNGQTDFAQLLNMRSNRANAPWRTYGKVTDMTAPRPSSLWVLVDEDQFSIDDASFDVCMVAPPTAWYSWPGTYHNFAASFAFADGHTEPHKWKDGRSKAPATLALVS